MKATAMAYLLLVSGASVLSAQEAKPLPPIDTDRPDLTDGAATIARGHVQLESGYTRVTSRLGETAYSTPEILARIGVFTGAELRIGVTYRSAGDPGAGGSGWDDLQLGTKIRLVRQRGNRPSFSMEAFTSVPTGASAVSAGRALPGAAVLTEWDGEGPWSAGAELQVARDPGDGISWAPSLSIQYRPWDPLQFYGELYTLRSTGALSPGETYFNTGILFLLSNDVQVDARIGIGLNHAASRNYFGFGLALRR